MKIITAVVNNPIFIEIQYHSLKKFIKGDYEFIVFNDAKEFCDLTNEGDTSIKSKIKDLCSKLNIKSINIPNESHKEIKDPGIRCANSMNYILNYQLKNPDNYLVIDSDMFLIAELDLEKFYNYEFAIVLQNREIKRSRLYKLLNPHKPKIKNINYFWNGIYYFDITKMKNLNLLNWDTCKYCDVGGMMQEWLKIQMNKNIEQLPQNQDNNSTKIQDNTFHLIQHLISCSWGESEIPENLKHNNKLISFLKNDPRNQNNKFYCEIYDDIFLHYRAGGNWNKEGMKLHFQLSEDLKSALI